MYEQRENILSTCASSLQPPQPGYSQPPPPAGASNQPGMQPPYQQGPQSMGNNTMPPVPGMTANHMPNSAPNQNANLSSSFGRMSLQVNIFIVLESRIVVLHFVDVRH